MIVTFTLQNQYSGATYVAGPFNISGTTDGNVSTELATGITKEQLLTGYTINGVNDSTTGGTIASTGICTNTQQWVAFPQPTPTPTSSVAQFTVSPAYGITFGTITHSMGTVPSFAYPILSQTSESMVDGYGNGTQFEIIASGTRVGGQTVNINVQKNGEVIGFVDLTSDPMGQQTYYITLLGTVAITDNLTISVGLGAGSLGY